jgi:hypothetical protein
MQLYDTVHQCCQCRHDLDWLKRMFISIIWIFTVLLLNAYICISIGSKRRSNNNYGGKSERRILLKESLILNLLAVGYQRPNCCNC